MQRKRNVCGTIESEGDDLKMTIIKGDSAKTTNAERVLSLCGIVGSVAAMLFCSWVVGGSSVSRLGVASTKMSTDPYATGLVESVMLFIALLVWHIWVDFRE